LVYGGFTWLGASAAAQAAGRDPAWLETALGTLGGTALSLLVVSALGEVDEPTPEKTVMLGISLLVPPIIGAVVGNQLGQRDVATAGRESNRN
jgi:hypothetical protein